MCCFCNFCLTNNLWGYPESVDQNDLKMFLKMFRGVEMFSSKNSVSVFRIKSKVDNFPIFLETSPFKFPNSFSSSLCKRIRKRSHKCGQLHGSLPNLFLCEIFPVFAGLNVFEALLWAKLANIVFFPILPTIPTFEEAGQSKATQKHQLRRTRSSSQLEFQIFSLLRFSVVQGQLYSTFQFLCRFCTSAVQLNYSSLRVMWNFLISRSPPTFENFLQKNTPGSAKHWSSLLLFLHPPNQPFCFNCIR